MAKIPKDAQVELATGRQKIAPDAEVAVESPPAEPGFLEKAGNFAKEGLESGAKALNDVRNTPLRLLANGVEAELSPSAPTGAALRSFGHGASYGLTDKLRGLSGAADEAGMRVSPFFSKEDGQFPNASFLEALKKRYAMERDASYAEQDAADKTQPFISGAAKVAGAVAAPNPFGKLRAVGLAGRLASGAGQGELYGLGASRAEDVEGKLNDSARSGAVGLAGAVAAEPVGALAKRFGALKAAGESGMEAKVQKAATKDLKTDRGVFGSASKEPLAAYRTLETEVAAGVATPEQVAEFEAFKASPLGVATRQRAIGNLLKQLPGHEDQMVEAEAAYNASRTNAEPAAVAAKTKDELGKSVLLEEVAPRIDRLVGNKALSMVGQFGGAPITTTKNLLKAPLMQYRAGQIGEGLTAPAAEAAKAAAIGAPALVGPEDDDSEVAKLLKRFGGR